MSWEIPESAAGDLIKFDFLPPVRRVEFRPAGSVGGIAIVEHTCTRPGPAQGTEYISAVPSADDDPYVVPFCGCRPNGTTYIVASSNRERMAELDAAGIPYLTYEFPRDPAQEGW